MDDTGLLYIHIYVYDTGLVHRVYIHIWCIYICIHDTGWCISACVRLAALSTSQVLAMGKSWLAKGELVIARVFKL